MRDITFHRQSRMFNFIIGCVIELYSVPYTPCGWFLFIRCVWKNSFSLNFLSASVSPHLPYRTHLAGTGYHKDMRNYYAFYTPRSSWKKIRSTGERIKYSAARHMNPAHVQERDRWHMSVGAGDREEGGDWHTSRIWITGWTGFRQKKMQNKSNGI